MTPKPANDTTVQMNRAVRDLLDFGDRQDFADATRGFVAALEPNVIRDARGRTVFDMERFGFLDGEAPDSVNPSLWRQAQLNRISGVFTIHPRIHQVRGHDLANMTLIEGETGWVLIDPLLSVAAARASLAFANEVLGHREVRAVIYTHCHSDHFGGVAGVIDAADVKSGRIPVLAPDGFMENAVAENVLAGAAMNRRAIYMFGNSLPAGPQGLVCCGLGKATSRAAISLIAPTDIVRETGETRVLDGVEIEFQMANGSEAPAEFMFYFPQFRALCASEVTTHNMHNVLTPRGAQVRNALHWSKYIDEAIELFGERTDLCFASHHWPTWDSARIRGFLERQRDLYRFMHDETLRLANGGYTIDEIPEMLDLPAALARDFACRGYYGTLKHNVKAVYQFYLGWWDGVPATYDRLPPAERGARMVRAMGGADAVLAEARRAHDEGDDRWAAEILQNLVFADPDHEAGREMLADVYEQMGYRAEAATWRNIYLTGAQELRDGVDTTRGLSSQSPEMMAAIGVGMLLDMMAVRYAADRAGQDGFAVSLEFSDTDQAFALEAGNGVLNNRAGRRLAAPDVRVTLTEPAFYRLLARRATAPELMGEGLLQIDGDAAVLGRLFELMDEFDRSFAIVT